MRFVVCLLFVCWLLFIVCCVLSVFVVGCLLLVVGCSLCEVCLRFLVRQLVLLCVACGSLPVTFCMLFVAV